MRDAFEAGARGFVLKSTRPATWLQPSKRWQMQHVFHHAGLRYFYPVTWLMFQSTKGAATLPNISPRECQVLQLLGEGESTKGAASQLDISVKTAETHRSNLMQKLDLHSAAEMVLFAVRNGIIQVAVGGIDSPLGQQRARRALAS